MKEIADERGISSFHIDGPDCILSKEEILHLPHGQSEAIKEKGWLPDGELNVGITAGASTPNQVVADVIEKLFSLRK